MNFDDVKIMSPAELAKVADINESDIALVVRDNKFCAVQLQSLKGRDGIDGKDGAEGLDGSNGTDGKSAYSYAQDGGYSGDALEFAGKLAQLPSLSEDFYDLKKNLVTETGSWQPTLFIIQYPKDGGPASTCEVGFGSENNTSYGNFYRIGKLVFITGVITMDSALFDEAEFTILDGANMLADIEGLPFSIKNIITNIQITYDSIENMKSRLTDMFPDMGTIVDCTEYAETNNDGFDLKLKGSYLKEDGTTTPFNCSVMADIMAKNKHVNYMSFSLLYVMN